MGYSSDNDTGLISVTDNSYPLGALSSFLTIPVTITEDSWPISLHKLKTSSGSSFFTATPWTKPVPSLIWRKAIFPLDLLLNSHPFIVTSLASWFFSLLMVVSVINTSSPYVFYIMI